MKILVTSILAFLTTLPFQDKEALKTALKDTEIKGAWIYDDLDAGFTQAKKEGKPLCVVLRCVPCVTFRGIDRLVSTREDEGLGKLLDQFVCVRIVQAWGLDLSLFQCDRDLNWAVFLLNADRTIYARYGSKVGGKEGASRVSVDGLKKTLEGVLEAHRGYPANKKDFEAKAGAAPLWKTPEAIPDMKVFPNAKPADGSRANCVHCHMIQEAELWSLRSAKRPIPDAALWSYPMPDVLGLALEAKERGTVKAAAPGSPAEKGGFKTGDRIVRLQGQAIYSLADVQWVLETAKEGIVLEAELDRDGSAAKATLALAEGWRRKDDFTWRSMIWKMRHRLLGLSPVESLSAEERGKLGLAAGGLALRVKKFPPDFVKDRHPDAQKVFKIGDILVGVDGRRDLPDESSLVGYLMQKKASGDVAEFDLLRDGKPVKASLTMP